MIKRVTEIMSAKNRANIEVLIDATIIRQHDHTLLSPTLDKSVSPLIYIFVWMHTTMD